MSSMSIFKYAILVTLMTISNNFAGDKPIEPIYISFRIDDCGIDSFEIYENILPLFSKYKIPLTLGVVPFHTNGNSIIRSLSPQMISFLKPFIYKENIEIALHGYLHRNNCKYSSFSSEFAGLEKEDQKRMILAGKNELERTFGIPISTFIPPWNTYDENTLEVLTELGFKNLSGARYGQISCQNIDLNFIPYTCDLLNIQKTVYKLLIENTTPDEKVIVALFHDYNFAYLNKSTSNSYSRTNSIELFDFEKILEFLHNQKQIVFLTIGQFEKYQIDFSSIRLRNCHYKSIFLPLPTILSPTLAGYYKNYSRLELLLIVYLIPAAIYIIVIGAGVVVGLLVNTIPVLYGYKGKIIAALSSMLIFIILLIVNDNLDSLGIMAFLWICVALVSILAKSNSG